MDVNTVRAIFTLLALLAFVAVVVWAYSSKNKARFEQDALLPFADEGADTPPAGEQSR
ncbi:MAG: cbb3-type cytochrome c oxidase subunit 3 [Deltaproteobacteria bacterium]|nr:cbb3-type cytochrome c oxidase subunit 3 [Deltaproteobacteria bacterium]